LPRAAATCAASIIRNSKEVRPDNTTANHTVGDGTYTIGPWATEAHWVARNANFRQVQGQFTGTTTEMFSWAGCRWGIDEDTLRAVAVQESYWHISTVGDYCGKPGEGSYGLTQIKNATCDGKLAWGGYPDSTQSSAFDVDFYGAYLRSCYDGDYYDGGSWLYGGRTVTQIAAAHSWDYVLWGCIGSWFSGGWYDSGAQSYISGVKAHLANRDWEKF
jgi:autotransporter family porin